MKILQVFNQYRFRGGEEAWVDSIPKLLGDSAIVDELRFHSDDWTGPNRPSLLQQARWIGNNPASRSALRDKAKSFRPDVLLFHNVIPVGSLGLYEEANKLGIPVLQYTHNFRPFSPGGTLWDGYEMTDAALRGNPWPEILSGSWQSSRLKTAILAWHLHQSLKNGLLDCIDHWLAISDFMRNQFIAAGIPKSKISTMRHCWPTHVKTAPAVEGKHYLYLGRLVPEKGIFSLINAWKKLSSGLGERCPKLTIAGDGPLESIVCQAAESIDRVQYAGFVQGDEKENLIKSARAIMVPSIWLEPLGLTTYDAYAHAKPVIASKVGALQETVFDDVTGWLHIPNDADDIARVVMIAESTGFSGLRDRGVGGLRWLKDHADPTAWRDHFISLCKEVIHRSKTNKA